MKRLSEIIEGSKRLVFFGGAGVSTESGIPDFRSVDGLYRQAYDYPPETILSHSFFFRHPDVFFRFFREKMLIDGAKPNAAHRALAALEKRGILSAVVTQNIDGLHTAAGSEKVFELHGSTLRNTCLSCGAKVPTDVIRKSEGIPRCPDCGGIVKPDVVLYEEPLDGDVTEGAIRAIAAADTLIIAGTSLSVYPAASFIDFFRGEHLVLINKGEVARATRADLVISAPVGEVLAAATGIE